MRYLRVGALVLLLACSGAAQATVYDFSFSGWENDVTFTRGSGVLQADGFGSGLPIFVLSGTTSTTLYSGGPGCNLHPSTCTPSGGSTGSITAASFWEGRGPPLALTFRVTTPQMGIGTSVGGPPGLTLSLSERPDAIAVPAPIAGAGLPVLAGLAGAWFVRRRKQRLAA